MITEGFDEKCVFEKIIYEKSGKTSRWSQSRFYKSKKKEGNEIFLVELDNGWKNNFLCGSRENWKVEWHDEPVKRENVSRDEKKTKLLARKLASFRKTISTRTFTTRFFIRPFLEIKRIENEKIKFSFRFHIKFLVFISCWRFSRKKERNDENEERRRRIIQLS